MFLGAAVILAVTPGQGIAYVLARTIAGGRRDGLASAVGTAADGFVHVLAAALGLSALLAESAQAFAAIKFCEGIVVEALNVKTALFFLAFIPQFIDPSASTLGQFVVLGSICVILNTTADVVVVLGASRIRASQRLGRLLTAGSGCSLVALGAWTALAKVER